MRWNKKLSAAKLYLILDSEVLDYKNLIRVLKDSVRNGVDSVQLRDKKSSAKEILQFCREILKVTRHQVPLIVNDRLDIAMIANADGVHLGQDDTGCLQARKILGPGKIIGVSCQTLAHAKKAQADGADYIGFGSVFKTKTKPWRQAMDLKLLRQVITQIKIPVFAIGGISRSNIGSLTALGVRRVAVCRDILLAGHAGDAVRDLKIFLRR